MNVERARKIMTILKQLATTNEKLGVNDLRMIVALERAVARIEVTAELARNLIFKGGFVLLKSANSMRFTRDIDALAKDMKHNHVMSSIKNALSLDLDDGLWYGDIKTRDLGKELTYPGIRFDAAFQIGEPPAQENKIKKLSRIHLDIGFGDFIPAHKIEVMPSILPDSKPISWSVYPLEQIVAEKLHALIMREAGNSRAKDIYDLVLLFRNKTLDLSNLLTLIQKTFAARHTELPNPIYRDIEFMDLTILRSAWRSLELMGASEVFDLYWKELMIYLHQMHETKFK